MCSETAMARRGKHRPPIQINSVAEKLKAENQCRLCERRHKDIGPRELTRHRLVPGRHGGEYIVANVVPLCRCCHDAVEAQNADARVRLRPKLWPMEVAHVIRRMSEEWYDLAYPKPAFRAALLREADEAIGYEPKREQPKPNHLLFVKKRKFDYLDTINQASEKAMARQRQASKAAITKTA